MDQGAVDGLDNWNKQELIHILFCVIVSEQDNVLTEDLLDDGGHEEGDGDHGGGQEQEHQRGARHHQVGGAVRGLLQQTLSTQSWLREGEQWRCQRDFAEH